MHDGHDRPHDGPDARPSGSGRSPSPRAPAPRPATPRPAGLSPRTRRPSAVRPSAVRPSAVRPSLVGPSALRATAATLATVAALGLAACGGGGDDEATVAPDAGAAAPATTVAPARPSAGTDEESRAALVVTGYLAAFIDGDGEAVCKLYTPAERRRVAKAIDGTCAAGIRAAYAQGGAQDGFKQSLGNVRVGETTITGSTALVKLVALQAGTPSDAKLQIRLTRSGGTWLISKPSAG